MKDHRNEGERGQPGSRWIETTAYHMDVTHLENTEPMKTKDVYTSESKWFDMDNIPQPLHGSHDEILNIAREMYSF